MRRAAVLAVVLVVLSCAAPATLHAAEPEAKAPSVDPALAVWIGAATHIAGFAIGGAILGSGGDDAVARVGVYVVHSGFTLAPLVAHGAVGEWGRGAFFSIPPAASLAGTAGLFAYEPKAFDLGSLNEQRVAWLLLGLGMASSVVGIVDAAFVQTRHPKIVARVVPTVTAHTAGLSLGGVF